jgi:hypothetical protein
MLAPMRIEWTPSLRVATQRRDDRGGAADRSFSLSGGSDTAAATATPGTMATQAVAGLLSLQEISDELTGRRRAAARGDKLLDALEELRMALLGGTLPRAQLAALAHLCREHVPLVDDPRLAEILAEIELRAAVELAKLEQIQSA